VAEGAPEEEAKALASVKRKRIVREDGMVIYEPELKLCNKLTAINLLGKKLKGFLLDALRQHHELGHGSDEASR
jgi:hypothetical protein